MPENHVTFCKTCGRALSVKYIDYLTTEEFECKRCQQRARRHKIWQQEYPERIGQ